ncbi:MAG: glycerophosphodiester phosphodiesterase family protein [Acidimicrobiales bacterium]
MSPTRRFLDHPVPLALAHQGGAREAPENSLEAFERAVRLGYTHLETDARLTADGQVVLIHDDRLGRVSDRAGLVAQLTYAEIREARLRGPDGAPTDARVPLLSDVLARLPDAFLNIDAKEDRVVAPLIATLRAAGAADRVLVASFSAKRLRRLRGALGPEAASALTLFGVLAVRLRSYGLPVPRPKGDAAQVPERRRVLGVSVPVADRRFLRTARRWGIQVHVWTPNTRAELERLLDLGVDGIITDELTLLRQILDERAGRSASA